MKRIEELRRLTPGQVWKQYVGSQGVGEFVNINQERGIQDYAQMIIDYVEWLISETQDDPDVPPWTDEEIDYLSWKLLRFLEEPHY